MGRLLKKNERQWINKILSVDFVGREILQKQLDTATVVASAGYSFASLKFSIKEPIDKFPRNIRVPVEMRAFRSDAAPVLFLLHIIDGYANEMEILTADSSRLDLDSIVLEKVEYDVNKEVIL